MIEPKWVSAEVVLALHSILLAEHGGAEGIRDNTLLESALNRPKQKFVYNNDASLFALAAAYSFGLVRNHPFVDGNKRTAFTVGVLFLELNGQKLIASEPEATIRFNNLADGTLNEDDLSSWFAKNCIRDV
ncbi:MAG: type II toxin-antitoxin system death-on-curing family toxin [Pseudomonadota bacterium]